MKWTVKQILKHLQDPKNKTSDRYTYLIADGEYVKIGVSNDPFGRMSDLQIGNPRKLAMLGCATGNHESLLHSIFRPYRVRGEWFKLTSELQQIGDALGEDNRRAVLDLSAHSIISWLEAN